MHEVWNSVVIRELPWIMVALALMILLYAAGLRFEQDRQSIEYLQVKIEQIESRLNKDREVDAFLRTLEASGRLGK
jgi:hypothetical protein